MSIDNVPGVGGSVHVACFIIQLAELVNSFVIANLTLDDVRLGGARLNPPKVTANTKLKLKA
jgi:hypothetical protein